MFEETIRALMFGRIPGGVMKEIELGIVPGNMRTHSGAMVLVDEKLNTAAIRMYNEQNPSGDVTPPFVEEAAREFRPNNPIVKTLTKWLKPQAAPWSNLTDHIGKAVRIRRAHLERRILQGM